MIRARATRAWATRTSVLARTRRARTRRALGGAVGGAPIGQQQSRRAFGGPQLGQQQSLQVGARSLGTRALHRLTSGRLGSSARRQRIRSRGRLETRAVQRVTVSAVAQIVGRALHRPPRRDVSIARKNSYVGCSDVVCIIHTRCVLLPGHHMRVYIPGVCYSLAITCVYTYQVCFTPWPTHVCTRPQLVSKSNRHALKLRAVRRRSMC